MNEQYLKCMLKNLPWHDAKKWGKHFHRPLSVVLILAWCCRL